VVGTTSTRVAILVVALAAASCRPPPRVRAHCSGERAFLPFDAQRSTPSPEPSATGVLDALVAWYQRSGRAPSVPQGGCPFSPSCSVYARDAIARYGPLAIVLVIDRVIVREHVHASAYYPMICVDHATRLADEVP
jgi:putative component of membrane protein insertase Oxa1/YidC/SpoIIIJ protein YidD